jgi:hypothetical protein
MNLTVVGFPRSGTNWLHRILSYGHTVSKVHWGYQLLGGESIVYIRRDPRDTAVSGYYYYLQAFGWKWNHTIENFTLLDFLKTRFANGFDGLAGWPQGWKGHVEWASEQQFTIVSYEQMMVNAEDEIGAFLGHQPWLQEALVNEPPGSLKRVPYTRSPNWAKARKTVSPKPGEWVHHFGRDELKWMDNYLGRTK